MIAQSWILIVLPLLLGFFPQGLKELHIKLVPKVLRFLRVRLCFIVLSLAMVGNRTFGVDLSLTGVYRKRLCIIRYGLLNLSFIEIEIAPPWIYLCQGS